MILQKDAEAEVEEDRGVHEVDAGRESWLPDVLVNHVEDQQPVELPAEEFDVDVNVVGDVDGDGLVEIPSTQRDALL